MKKILTGFYKHYKGDYYKVIGVGTHTETHKRFVVYHDQNEKIWLRPEKMFAQKVIVNKQHIPRFTFISKNDF
jgi:hypothetical protein